MRARRLLWPAAAATCALALGAVLPARADSTPTGPVQPGTAPLGAVSYTPTGDIGKAGGLTWTYSGLTSSVVGQFQSLEWGPTDVEMGMDDALHPLGFDAGASNLANGMAVWSGSSSYTYLNPVNAAPITEQLDTRLVVTVSGASWNATSYGGGATVPVTGNYAASLLLEVAPHGTNSWTPAKDYFNEHPNNVPGNEVVESVTAGFFYVLADTPVASLDATTYDFGDQLVGSASAPHEFTLSNTGNADLHVSSVSPSGDAAVASETCTAQAVAAGGSCTIDVTITPSAPGASSGTVTVTDDAADPQQTISLSADGVQPALSLSASSLSLDSTAVGATSKAKTLAVTNTGTGALHVTSVTVGGVNAGDFSATPTGCDTVQPGNSCQVSVTFSPSATGARAASLTIGSDAPSSPDQVALSGTGLDIHVAASPSPLSYGDVLVGQQKELTLTFTNTGSDPGMITGMPAFSGANAGDFSLDEQSLTCQFGNGGGPVIPANGSCSLGIVFRPADSGGRTATLSVPTNASDGTLSVTVVGNGIHPLVTPTPTSLTFDPQALGTTSAAKDVTVVNTGTTPLSISAVSSGGDFVADGSACTSAAVAPAASCAIHVRFKPTAVGSRSGSLEIDSNAASSPNLLSLAGAGIDPKLSAPAGVDFGGVVVGQSATQQITIGSTGTTAVSIGTVAISGSGFAIVGDGCSLQTVAGGGSCVVTVRFAPAAGGAAVGALTVPSNAPSTPDAVALSGTGLAGTFAASRSPLDFGNVLDGTTATKTVTITNSGTGPVTFTGVSIVGPDHALFSTGAGSTCSSTTVLAAGDGCTLEVVFSPVADGSASASLQLSGNATNAPLSVGLGGSGVSPQLSVSPAGLSFGGQPQGTTSAAQAVTVTSSGTSGLDVASVSATGPFTVAESCTSAGPIAPGGTCTVKVAFAPSAVGAAAGILTVVSDGGTKTVPLGGTGTASADLNVSIGANTKVAKKNGSLVYTVTVLNAGPSAAAGTTAVDALPSDEEFTSLSAPAGVTCTTPAPGASGTLKCNLGTLMPGGSVSFAFYVKVTTRKSTVTDSVSATSQAYDPDPGDNQASVTTPIK